MNCAQPGGWDRLAQKVGQRRPAVGEVYQEQSVRWNRGLSARQGSPCFMFTTELRLFIPRRLQSPRATNRLGSCAGCTHVGGTYEYSGTERPGAPLSPTKSEVIAILLAC